jgi:NTP pyrophosphatase (non-canonical NTP hydrolase)
MNLHEYQAAITRTCATTDLQDTLKLALVGLFDELGEIAGPLKKYLWQGHDLDTAHLQEEVGDVLWYLATLCNALSLTLDAALAGNLAKLQKRYPDGFSVKHSRDRSRVTEAEAKPVRITLRLKLWEAANDAMFLSWDSAPLTPEEITYLGEQLGALTRFLARRSISPLDDTSVPASSQKEV